MSGVIDAAEPQIHKSTTQRLVYMANQIAAFFVSQGTEEHAVLGVADHIKSFWDPVMLRGIYAHLDDHKGEGLTPIALKAIQRLHGVKAGGLRAALESKGIPSGRGPGDDGG